MIKNSAYILLGSNLGNREMNLSMARNLIANSVGEVLLSSEIYESAAWGKEDQPNFLNQVIKISTLFKPVELLEKLLWTEKSLGRLRKIKWGERIIDLDILFYEDEVISTPQLVVPHPEIPNRRFTLLPLIEIAANIIHPVLNKSIEQLLEECSDQLEVWPHTKVNL